MTSESKTVRIGFIGAGPRAVGLIKTCKTIKGLKITAICDRFVDLAYQGKIPFVGQQQIVDFVVDAQ